MSVGVWLILLAVYISGAYGTFEIIRCLESTPGNPAPTEWESFWVAVVWPVGFPFMGFALALTYWSDKRQAERHD